jgi:hypothetical protein
MQGKLPRGATLPTTYDPSPEPVDSPSLMERLRAVAVGFDDPFAGQPYKPKRRPRLKAKARFKADPISV